MHALCRGGRAAAPPGASRSGPQPFQAFCHGKIALMLQHQSQRQALLVAAAKKRYQDFDQDSLDLDSMDEMDTKLDKYADLLQSDGTVAQAATTPKGARTQSKTFAQQAPPAAAPRGPASFSSFDDDADFGFDESWGTSPTPPGGNGGGYMNGGGGGGGGGGYMNGGGGNGAGYMNGGGGGGGYMNGGSYGGSGYMNGSGYGSYGQGGYVDPGFGSYGGGYSGGGYGGGSYGGGYLNGGYTGATTRQRNSRGSFRHRYDEFEEDVDEIDGEKPVVKVDSCVINGKKMQCNHGITAREVFVLAAGPERQPLGTMPTSRAQALADEAKEDLLLINPEAHPPVARIIKWDKYKYELEKTAKEKKAKSTTTELKEVRMRPSTDSGDIEVKLKSCKKFLSKGDRVKLVMKFEGREVQFKEQGKEVLLNFISELASVAKVEGPLNFKTGTYTILLAPKGP